MTEQSVLSARAKLSPSQAQEIANKYYSVRDATARSLAQEFGVSSNSVSLIVKGRTYRSAVTLPLTEADRAAIRADKVKRFRRDDPHYHHAYEVIRGVTEEGRWRRSAMDLHESIIDPKGAFIPTLDLVRDLYALAKKHGRMTMRDAAQHVSAEFENPTPAEMSKQLDIPLQTVYRIMYDTKGKHNAQAETSAA